MRKLELIQLDHSIKIGDTCGAIEPNITEDTLFTQDGEIVGFYIKDISKHNEKLSKYVNIANTELRSKRVPKSVMKRSSGLHNKDKEVLQYSTIIGGVPPKPHMRRPYATMSSVHKVKTADIFVKAMLLTCKESEELIKKIAPKIYEQQVAIIEENIPKKWRFGKMFTSSITN